MASLRDIKRRIGSVKNTQKITRAMKMVAASKLRRSQEAIVRARPYAYRMRALVQELTTRADAQAHPLLRAGGRGPVALLVLTSDRGLCGSFNATIVQRTLLALEREFGGREVRITAIGRKGLEALKRRGKSFDKTYTGVMDGHVYNTAMRLMKEPVEAFGRGEIDAVYVLYNEFRSAISQRVRLERLLPFSLDAGLEGEIEGETTEAPEDTAGGRTVDFVYEPSEEDVLDALLRRHLSVQMHRVLYESAASEHGARMTAMDGATKNAGDVIDRLTLQYNRARQDQITKELIEVISGAEAL